MTFSRYTGVLTPYGNGLVNQTSTFTTAQLINRIPNDMTKDHSGELEIPKENKILLKSKSVMKSVALVSINL